MHITRSKKGVLVSLGTDVNNQTALVLDDIVQLNSENCWEKDCFITLKEINNEDLEKLNFSEQELADFGHYILSRIRAFKVLNEL